MAAHLDSAPRVLLILKSTFTTVVRSWPTDLRPKVKALALGLSKSWSVLKWACVSEASTPRDCNKASFLIYLEEKKDIASDLVRSCAHWI